MHSSALGAAARMVLRSLLSIARCSALAPRDIRQWFLAWISLKLRVVKALFHRSPASIWNLGLDQLCQLRERFLPAEIAHLGRNDVRHAFLHDVQFRPA